MQSDTAPDTGTPAAARRGAVRRALVAFYGPLGRSITYKRLAYLLLSFPLGIAYFTFLVTAIATSIGLVIIWVGIPLLALTVIAWRACGWFEALLMRNLLDEDVVAPPPVPQARNLWERTKAMVRDRFTWSSLGWLFLTFPIGIIAFVVIVTLTSVTASMIAVPFLYAFVEQPIDTASYEVGWWVVPAALSAGVLLVGLWGQVVGGMGWLVGSLGRVMVSESRVRQLEERGAELEEKTRLAHELHDAVGHTVTVMVMQAGTARVVFDSNPDFAREALGTIEDKGRQALGELDRILDVLREGTEIARAPTPHLTDVARLVADVTEAGLVVDLAVDGDLSTVPEDASRSAYRIVQETLTNVIKHVGPVAVEVRLTARPEAVEIAVLNAAGQGGPDLEPDRGAPDRVGHGIIGIRERVALFGGDVDIGPTGDGFRVWARLPYTRTEERDTASPAGR